MSKTVLHVVSIFLQHEDDLFLLEMSEDKLNHLPDGVWKKLAIVCGFYSVHFKVQ